MILAGEGYSSDGEDPVESLYSDFDDIFPRLEKERRKSGVCHQQQRASQGSTLQWRSTSSCCSSQEGRAAQNQNSNAGAAMKRPSLGGRATSAALTTSSRAPTTSTRAPTSSPDEPAPCLRDDPLGCWRFLRPYHHSHCQYHSLPGK